MSFIIAVRNPSNKKILIIEEGDSDSSNIAEFPTEIAASDATVNISICRSWGYQIIEVD